MVDPAQFKDRDVVARAFADLYRTQHRSSRRSAANPTMRSGMKAAYPIHPGDIRPALQRLVYAGKVPADARRVASDGGGDPRPVGEGRPQAADHAVQHPDRRSARAGRTDPLSAGQWEPIIEKDVDGPNSLPLRIDGEVPNLGKFAATRRVARTLYLGSAPYGKRRHRGIEDRRIKLGCVMPGESPAVFGERCGG